jgi:hypothetical protein
MSTAAQAAAILASQAQGPQGSRDYSRFADNPRSGQINNQPSASNQQSTFNQPFGMTNFSMETGVSESLHPEQVHAGVGILLQYDAESKSVQVKTCVKGGAAQRDGFIQAGDVIAAVDSKSSLGIGVDEVRAMIVGPQGSHVRIQLERASGNTSFERTLRRGTPEFLEACARSASQTGTPKHNTLANSTGPSTSLLSRSLNSYPISSMDSQVSRSDSERERERERALYGNPSYRDSTIGGLSSSLNSSMGRPHIVVGLGSGGELSSSEGGGAIRESAKDIFRDSLRASQDSYTDVPLAAVGYFYIYIYIYIYI